MVKRVDVVDYDVYMAGGRKPRRVLHVNMLRELHDPAESVGTM